MRISRNLAAAAIGLAALGIAGCGASGTSAPAHHPAAIATIAVTPSVAKVAADHSVTIVKIQQPTRYTVGLAGALDATGQPIEIATFASTADRDAWLKAATQFGTVLWTDPLDVGIGLSS